MLPCFDYEGLGALIKMNGCQWKHFHPALSSCPIDNSTNFQSWNLNTPRSMFCIGSHHKDIQYEMFPMQVLYNLMRNNPQNQYCFLGIDDIKTYNSLPLPDTDCMIVQRILVQFTFQFKIKFSSILFGYNTIFAANSYSQWRNILG